MINVVLFSPWGRLFDYRRKTMKKIYVIQRHENYGKELYANHEWVTYNVREVEML